MFIKSIKYSLRNLSQAKVQTEGTANLAERNQGLSQKPSLEVELTS